MKRSRPRRGAATVEMALLLPVLFLLIFGSIEACNMVYLKQVLAEAAYEGAMVGMKKNATSNDVTERVEMVTGARNIGSVQVTSGQDGVALEDVPRGELFYVRVTAATSGNLYGPQLFALFDQMEINVQALKQ